MKNPWGKDEGRKNDLIVFGDVESLIHMIDTTTPKDALRFVPITEYVNAKFGVNAQNTDEALIYLKGGMIFFYACYNGTVEEFLEKLSDEEALEIVVDLVDSLEIDEVDKEGSNTVFIGLGKQTYVLTVDLRKLTADVSFVKDAKEVGWPEKYELAPIEIELPSGTKKMMGEGIAAQVSLTTRRRVPFISPFPGVSSIPDGTTFTTYRLKGAPSNKSARILALVQPKR